VGGGAQHTAPPARATASTRSGLSATATVADQLPEKSNTPAKSFDSSNNDVQKPAGKLTSSLSNNTSSAGFAANPQPGNFNGFKVFGISSLNPYQNKFVLL
jgi:hypothetical protein